MQEQLKGVEVSDVTVGPDFDINRLFHEKGDINAEKQQLQEENERLKKEMEAMKKPNSPKPIGSGSKSSKSLTQKLRERGREFAD